MNEILRFTFTLLVFITGMSAYGQEVNQKKDIRNTAKSNQVVPKLPTENISAPGSISGLKTEYPLTKSSGAPDSERQKPHLAGNPGLDSTKLGVYPLAKPTPAKIPFNDDYKTSGNIITWKGGALTGFSSHENLPALFMRQNAGFGLTQSFGNLTLSANAGADRYHFDDRGTHLMFNYGAQMRYAFNGGTSLTLFGNYSTNRNFYSMAAMPYMGSTGYGGYVTFMGESIGVDLGVRREYNVFSRQWRTVPIVTPKVRFSRSVMFELPVGDLIGEMLDNAVHKNSPRTGPMIAPPDIQMPGQIPFAPPEVPRGH